MPYLKPATKGLLPPPDISQARTRETFRTLWFRARRMPRRAGIAAVLCLSLAGWIGPSAAWAGTATYVNENVLGLDTCEDPSRPVLLKFWEGTPYNVWGMYVGGDEMGCSQPNLSNEYFQNVTHGTNQQWSLGFFWVGNQDPCSGHKYTFSTNTTTDYYEGYEKAGTAVKTLYNYGLYYSYPVTYDMEGFGGSGNTACVEEAQAYINGWDKYIAEAGHAGEEAGVYGSVGSPCPGGSDLPAYASIKYVPNYIWGADWDGKVSTWEMGGCLGELWKYKQRLKQYEGNAYKCENGACLYVDADSTNGPLYFYPPES